MRRWLALAGGAAMLATASIAACDGRGNGEVTPPPARIPYLKVKLPPSTRAYHSYESGMQHAMLQLRFVIDRRDLPTLASRLPCKLGPAEEGSDTAQLTIYAVIARE
jgi:hypothetical protein